MNINYYIVYAQYRESYGARWKMKLGENFCVVSTEPLTQEQIEDYLCEQGKLWANQFSRQYMIGCHRQAPYGVHHRIKENLEDYGEPLKFMHWQKGKPL